MAVVNRGKLLLLVTVPTVVTVATLVSSINTGQTIKKDPGVDYFIWWPPDTSQIPHTPDGMLVRYGRDLIGNTAYYFGPKGKIEAISNGMNCQNCHLDAGTRLRGNNYGAVFSTYPKFRERSGTIEDIYKRVNDCLDRSLNGHPIDTGSHEMRAIYAYIKWLGRDVRKGITPYGTGIATLPFLDRAADPAKGKIVYTEKCQRCHGDNGQGKLNADMATYQYPPLWGDNSYNTGAGLFRLSRLAGYVKDNMPYDKETSGVDVSTAEAWDVAAFVNSQPRPHRAYAMDRPNVSGKPFDYPFGPYADGFPEEQHKFGPYAPIRMAQENAKNKTH